MVRKGKEFEELVTRIESLLTPDGAIIKSPDYIKQKISGKKREVDASIRCKVGSVPILITIECRNRNSSEDIRWIEELTSKKENIGANTTIAVTSSDFSENAVMQAKQSGIEIRTIKEISDTDILNWPKALQFQLRHILCGLGPLLIGFYDDGDIQDLIILPECNELFKKDGLGAAILVRKSDGSTWSVSALYSKTVCTKPQSIKLTKGEEKKVEISQNSELIIAKDQIVVALLEGVPLDGTKVTKRLELKFPKGEFCMHTSRGLKDVVSLSINIAISLVMAEAPRTKVVEYYSDEKSILQLRETEMTVDYKKDLKIQISQYRIM